MPTTLIVTVGSTPQPLIKTILEHKPQFVCFLCSQASVEKISEIKSAIKEQLGSETLPFRDQKIIVDDIDDLLHCYNKARECISKLEEWGVAAEETVVDYTGGTKTMSVALALATIRQGYTFSYVGGHERTKDGLGIVVDGTEEISPGINPWSLFAIEERRQIAEFFNIYQFAAAERATRNLLSRRVLDPSLKQFLEIAETLCSAYSMWDRFKHQEAVDLLKKASSQLEAYIQIGRHIRYESLLQAMQENLTWLQHLQSESRGFKKPVRRLIADLVANAARRAEEGKYDDAVARLYRALELDGQVALTELGVEDSSNVPENKIPESLRDDYLFHYRDNNSGKIKLPLFAVFRLLIEVKHPRGLAFLEHEERLRGVLSSRNSSILAHGLAPVDEKAYRSLSETLCESLNLDEYIQFPEIPVE